MTTELLQLPNLLSLSRIVLAGVICYLLAVDTVTATTWAGIVIIIAGITDGLDGYIARRMGQVTRLGIALDPFADKLFAIVLLIGLIIWRDFPLWLAFAIVARDLLILLGGLWLRQGRELDLPSNLTGKWAFAAIATLLGAYVIRFQGSIELVTPIVVIMLVASLISYGRVFATIRAGRKPQPFKDTLGWKLFRYILLGLAFVYHVVMFYREFLSGTQGS